MLAARRVQRRSNGASWLGLSVLSTSVCPRGDLAASSQSIWAWQRTTERLSSSAARVTMARPYAREGTYLHPTGRLEGRGRDSRGSRGIGATAASRMHTNKEPYSTGSAEGRRRGTPAAPRATRVRRVATAAPSTFRRGRPIHTCMSMAPLQKSRHSLGRSFSCRRR